ncbi:4Fe-4S binding protein [Candidatus Margulisiibacteriota bacterium]
MSDINLKTVDFVVDKWLCTSCGTCVGVCPVSAIDMVINKYGIYVPLIDKDVCTNCGLCVKVCPGHSFDYPYYSKKKYLAKCLKMHVWVIMLIHLLLKRMIKKYIKLLKAVDLFQQC